MEIVGVLKCQRRSFDYTASCFRRLSQSCAASFHLKLARGHLDAARRITVTTKLVAIREIGAAIRTYYASCVAHLHVNVRMIMGCACADADELFLTDIDFPYPDIVLVPDGRWPRFRRAIRCARFIFRASCRFGRLEYMACCNPTRHPNNSGAHSRAERPARRQRLSARILFRKPIRRHSGCL